MLWILPLILTLAGDDAPLLVPDRLYHGVGGPVMLTVEAAPETRGLVLVLLGADGAPAAAARELRPGRLDLAAVMPEVWMIRRACYLQCLHQGQPVGSALVVQPMLSRLEPRTVQVEGPDGSTHHRIVGWGPEPPPPPSPADPSGEGETPTPEPAPRPPERVFSGLRIYPERDVVLQTSHGDIVLALSPEHAPNTVWSFLQLVEGGFYDGLVFHRIVPLTRRGLPFVIQTGDPTGGGEGGPGFRLDLEPSVLPHDFGVISMARGDDPDSAGSQFFIGLSREGTAHLDGQYCAFGYAVAGGETIRVIAAVELADVATGRPVDPPVIRHAILIPAPPRVPGVGRPDRSVAEQERWAREIHPDRIPR